MKEKQELEEPNGLSNESLEKALGVSGLERDNLSKLAQSNVKRRFSIKKMTKSTLNIYRGLLLEKGFSPLVLGK